MSPALDAPSLDRFSTIPVRTVLLGGAKSPEVIGSRLRHKLAAVIPQSRVMMLPGLGHLAPENQPARIAAVLATGRGARG